MRYYDFAETALVRAILTFDGPTWEDSSPVASRMHLTVVRRMQADDPSSPWRFAWQREFGDAPAPNGAWNGFDLVCVAEGRVIMGVGTGVMAFDAQSGEPRWTTFAGNTIVRHLLPLPVPWSGIVVQSGYYGFDDPESRSNLACLTGDGKETWRVRLPGSDIFSGRPTFADNCVRAGTWGGFEHCIDPGSGRILDSIFTK